MLAAWNKAISNCQMVFFSVVPLLHIGFVSGDAVTKVQDDRGAASNALAPLRLQWLEQAWLCFLLLILSSI